MSAPLEAFACWSCEGAGHRTAWTNGALAYRPCDTCEGEGSVRLCPGCIGRGCEPCGRRGYLPADGAP